MSTIEAAERLGLSPSTVRRRIQSGELAAIQIGGDWRIPTAVVDAATNPPTTVTELDRLDALPAFIDAEHAGRILGMTADTVRYHLRQGHLPCRRFGRRVLIPTARLAAICAGQE